VSKTWDRQERHFDCSEGLESHKEVDLLLTLLKELNGLSHSNECIEPSST
jgi:hypothetical protein